jgi:hypothetical protein
MSSDFLIHTIIPKRSSLLPSNIIIASIVGYMKDIIIASIVGYMKGID